MSLVINLIANGKTREEIIIDYPYLELEDIRQALLYAVWLTEKQTISEKDLENLEIAK